MKQFPPRFPRPFTLTPEEAWNLVRQWREEQKEKQGWKWEDMWERKREEKEVRDES